MATARREEIERTLAERVGRRVAGRGVPPHAVAGAISRVLDALPPSALEAPAPAEYAAAGGGPTGSILVAVTARSVPDLGSRLRAALQRDGMEPGEIGLAAAGSHTVATVRIPAAWHDAVSRTARALGYSMTVVPGEGT